MTDSLTPPQSLDEFLERARADAAAGNPQQVRIRDLVGFLGVTRRGADVVRQIRRKLRQHLLAAEPDVAEGYIDDLVTLRALPNHTGAPTGPASGAPTEEESLPPLRLTVASVESASRGVVSVNRDDPLAKARALMLAHDFSQLPVIAGERNLLGAVSWESIAKASMRGTHITLGDARVTSHPVGRDDDLLALVPRILDEGFVFVQDQSRRLIGIVTVVDLGQAFANLANPFFLIGEIERRLKMILDRHWRPEELAAFLDPRDSGRGVDGASDLSMGEILRIFENPGRWSRLNWDMDRGVFIQMLDQVKGIRNSVMHFSPDLVQATEMTILQRFSRWLRVLEPAP